MSEVRIFINDYNWYLKRSDFLNNLMREHHANYLVQDRFVRRPETQHIMKLKLRGP